MKKTFMFLVSILVVFFGIAGSVYMMGKTQNNISEEESEEIIVSDKVTDECVEEYEDSEIEDVEAVNSGEIEQKEYEESYMLRDVNGKINIYKLDENGEETLFKETDIATEYLTETDKINMDNRAYCLWKRELE